MRWRHLFSFGNGLFPLPFLPDSTIISNLF
jgi:hypothetical protein